MQEVNSLKCKYVYLKGIKFCGNLITRIFIFEISQKFREFNLILRISWDFAGELIFAGNKGFKNLILWMKAIWIFRGN